MKHSTYLIDDEEEILVAEEIRDEFDNVISFTEIQNGVVALTLTEYNDLNLPTKVSSFEDEELLNILECEYDESGLITEQRLLFGEDLYEQVLYEYDEEGLPRNSITLQDGEEVKRSVRTGNEREFTTELFLEKEFAGYVVYQEDARENRVREEMFGPDDELISRKIEEYDRSDRLLKLQEFNEKEELVSEAVYEYVGKQLDTVAYESRDAVPFTLKYFYNLEGDLIKQEKRSLEGRNLIEFQSFVYDEKGRCIEEVTVRTGGSDPFYGDGGMSARIHLIHKYD